MTRHARGRAAKKVYAFIDTNIFLDFYRDSTEATLSLLHRIGPVQDRIISTYQVEMEFLKNRQRVIQDALVKLKLQPSPNVPAIFADSATNTSMRALNKTASEKAALIRKRTMRLLRDPKRFDVVFKSLTGIFQSTSPYVLTRDMPERKEVKRLAWRRFILGYPPRKSGDNSVGDALNWEWIIRCGRSLQGTILLVSRDGDFGSFVDKEGFLNDQLAHEYRDRVGARRKLILTNRLSDALKELDVRVPQVEIDAEAAVIAESPNRVSDGMPIGPQARSFQEIVNYLQFLQDPSLRKGDLKGL
ncbi:MAG: PIN domain-containing protein [Gemmatimonadales bacterium]